MIDATVEDADTFMPEVDKTAWVEKEVSSPFTDPRTGVTYRFVDFERRR